MASANPSQQTSLPDAEKIRKRADEIARDIHSHDATTSMLK